MSRGGHILFILATALAAASTAPMKAGKVVCTTESGHVANEPAHESGHCPASQNSDRHEDQQRNPDPNPEPSRDVPLGQDELAARCNPHKESLAAQGSALDLLPAWLAPTP